MTDTKIKYQNSALILSSLILSLAIISYGIMNYIIRVKTLETSKEMQIEKDAKYNRCREKTYENYSYLWSRECKISGIDKKTDDCRLPDKSAQRLDEIKDKELETCLKLFSASD